MLASVYSYRVMVKSVSSCCVRGRWVLSDPVTYFNINNSKYLPADAAKSHFFLDAILSVKFQVPLVTVDMAEEIESDFFKQLDAADKKRYKEKLSKLGMCTDPY